MDWRPGKNNASPVPSVDTHHDSSRHGLGTQVFHDHNHASTFTAGISIHRPHQQFVLLADAGIRSHHSFDLHTLLSLPSHVRSAHLSWCSQTYTSLLITGEREAVKILCFKFALYHCRPSFNLLHAVAYQNALHHRNQLTSLSSHQVITYNLYFDPSYGGGTDGCTSW